MPQFYAKSWRVLSTEPLQVRPTLIVNSSNSISLPGSDASLSILSKLARRDFYARVGSLGRVFVDVERKALAPLCLSI